MSSGTRAATERRFAARASQARRGRLRRWFLVLLVLLAVGALAWVVGFSSALEVRTVEVSGADPADRAKVKELAGQEAGTPLARVDGDAVADRITDEVPGARWATVDRGWPHTLKVNVTSRDPALAVVEDEGGYRLVDIDGTVIRTVDSAPKGVPTVTAEDGADVSGHGVRAAQGMLKALPEDLREKVADVTVDGADQVSFRIESTRIVWGDESSPEVKVRVIPVLLEKKPGLIDVSAPNTPVTKG